jgi:hypothetical protein
MTVDLAYYACALGEINMSGIWCTWCKLSSDEWSEINHVRGELWNKNEMDEVRELIFNGTIADEPKNWKGCVDIGLFDEV